MRRTEPLDSHPKVHVISNRGSLHPNSSQNIYMTSKFNSNKKTQKNLINKYNNVEVDQYDRKNFRLNQINLTDLKYGDKYSLRENSDFVDIPRDEYEKYLNKETIVINDGMDTGEYKFIGAKTVLKEIEAPIGGVNLTEEEILTELNRRHKEQKEKKITYEIVDKYYALTEIRRKTVKKIEKNPEGKNYYNFYASLENSNYNNNINSPSGNKNYVATYSTSNYKTSNIKTGGTGKNVTGNYEITANFKVGGNNKTGGGNITNNYNVKTSSTANYKSGGGSNIKSESNFKSGGVSASNAGGYSREYRQDISLGKNLKSNMSYTNYNSITSLPVDNYSKYLLEQINQIRVNPQSFINVIRDAKANIKKDKYGRSVYQGKMKIYLPNGESAFNETIDFLKDLCAMDPLKYNSEITVMPPQNEHDIKDKEDLGRKVVEMVSGGINITSYWRDIIKDPEISFLLMIVDDNGPKSGMRRKDILNPEMKYIGISSVEINRSFVCYITLSS
jgi:hypothetical protein